MWLVSRVRAHCFLVPSLLASALLLTACGGDEEETAAATAPSTQTSSSTPPATPPPSSNSAPTISGSPQASVLQDTQYSFTPAANDADGDSLTFSVAGLPSWATFTPSTGRVRGTPTGADVGTYSNIVISVSDGTATSTLTAFAIEVVGTATGSATLSWTPPTQNSDGSPLTNLAGYRVYWGTTQGSYDNSVTVSNPGLASYVVDQLTPATWYFTLTALSSTGLESQFSNVASKVVQ